MALDDILISTGVDQLIRLVKEQGKIEIGAAAKELGQPIRTIEDWSHVLEEEGLVRVEYKLTKIYLVWQGPTKDYVAQKSGKITEKAGQAKQEITQLIGKVEKGGQELAEMEQELGAIKASAPFSPEDAARLKDELSALEEKYDASFESALSKMGALEKKLEAMKPKIDESGSSAPSKQDAEFSRDLASLSKFESTLKEQLEETDAFFESFQSKLEGFRKKIEEGGDAKKIGEIQDELTSVRSLKDEIMGAVEAIVDEQKALGEKLQSAEKKLSAMSDREDSVAGARKKLSEVRRMSEDAKKQRKNVTGQLDDTLSLVRKQMSRLREIAGRQEETGRGMQQLKDDYVDISEEISRANEELSARQKEISGRIALQMRALDGAGRGRLSKDEVLKVSALIRELKSEQARMEQNLLSLSKQTEVLRLEAEGTAQASAQQPRRMQVAAAAGGMGQEMPVPEQEGSPAGAGQDDSIAFVEKVKLTAEEEGDFERKRDELRSLIRKMWEESKGGS